MRNRKHFFIIVFLLSSCITGCVNLSNVHSYAEASADGIEKYQDLGYSFEQHCKDECVIDKIRAHNIAIDSMMGFDCSLYHAADSATQIIYSSIKDYFNGLSDLSNDTLTSYNVDSLKTSLTSGKFGKVEINKDQADAYSGIVKVLTRAVTDSYRMSKIKEYIEQANQPIQILLDKFQFIIKSNLVGELNAKKEGYYSIYKLMVLDTGLSEYEKLTATEDYYRKLSEINAKEDGLITYSNSLKKIAEGHQKLYDNRSDMKAKEFIGIISRYTNDIHDFISAFNTLKNQ
jgi:hypothetical protein